ncbi:MAG: rRNA methyltransferase, partial [Sphingomonas oligoaromativorans]
MTIRRTGPGGRQRVKTANGRTNPSDRWQERPLNEPYVRMAKSEGYRIRAAYNLI